MSEWVETGLPCLKCSSSDAMSVNSKGWAKCFSCYANISPEEIQGAPVMQEKEKTYKYVSHRGINEDTFRKYQVSTSLIDGVEFEVAFRYPSNSKKIRGFSSKKFRAEGSAQKAGLFGQNLFPSGSDTIVITEGEYDALAVHQMCNLPAVSVWSSNVAKKNCEEEWEYLNSFKKIILCFDEDAQGEKATREVASLFDFNKVFNCSMQQDGCKDANDYLKDKNLSEMFLKSIKGAKKFTPDNIISDFNDLSDKLQESKEDKLCEYPFSGLQEALYGLHRGEVVVFKGDEGIGKTELFRAIQNHILKTTDHGFGVIHLEEDEGTTIKGIANYSAEVPYLHQQDSSDPKEIMKHYKEAVKDDPNRVYIYSSFDVEDEEKLLDNIRFLVSACGCAFIFLDHITWLATGMDGEDERRKLDRISQKMKLLAKELGFCLIEISHTNDDGKTRGSRNITKVANTVVHMHRDKLAGSQEDKNKLWFSVEKARGGGSTTGSAGYALYDSDVLMLKEHKMEITV